MAARRIIISASDREKLQDLIQAGLNVGGESKDYLRKLKEELERSLVVDPECIPPDVVTMNSRVRFRDLDSGETSAYRIVYPFQANLERKKLSVLAPVGTALLGCRVNDIVEWPVPAGLRRLEITEVVFQPEAVGAFHL